jgi:CHASE2 domain-containing sensor protein
MQRRSVMQRCRHAAWKTWLGAALALWLLLAESFAVTHPFDQAAHSDGQPCAVCLSVAHLGAGAVAAAVALVLDAAPPLLAVVVTLVFFAAVPLRRYARGPPYFSFTS